MFAARQHSPLGSSSFFKSFCESVNFFRPVGTTRRQMAISPRTLPLWEVVFSVAIAASISGSLPAAAAGSAKSMIHFGDGVEVTPGEKAEPNPLDHTQASRRWCHERRRIRRPSR